MSLPVIEMKPPLDPVESIITENTEISSSEEELVIEEEDQPDEPEIFDKPKEVEQVEQFGQVDPESLAKRSVNLLRRQRANVNMKERNQ